VREQVLCQTEKARIGVRVCRAKEAMCNRIVCALEKPMAPCPFFGYCSCPLSMIRPIFPVATALCSAVTVLILSGCEKPQIRVYTVAKEAPPATPAPAAAATKTAPERAERPRPQVTYTLPAGWEEQAGNSLSLVNFVIKSDAGEATVNITPLAGMQGREAAIVNMWRSQVGQPALNDQEVASSFTAVEIAGGSGQLFEVTGAREGDNLRIVTAFAHRGDDSWFYKLQGNEAVVAAQKPAFLEFLKSVRIKEGSGSAETTAAPEPTKPTPKWTVPGEWQTLKPGQMQIAKFAVPAVDKAQAEVAVSVFPSDTGGTLANVNRWRRQLGLDDTDEAGLKECAQPIEGVPGAELVELANGEKRMLSAIVPREGTWWFYKMMGDAPAVNAARESFVQFAQSMP